MVHIKNVLKNATWEFPRYVIFFCSNPYLLYSKRMWGWGSGELVLSSLWFNKLPRWFCCKLKVEKHCLNQKETQGHSRIGEIHINYWRQGWLHCMAVQAPNLLLRPWAVLSMPLCSVERKGGRGVVVRTWIGVVEMETTWVRHIGL